jgi:hypothetical protein
MEAERERIVAVLDVPPDKTLSFVAEMDEVGGEGVETGIYACPMDADIVASWAGKCPKCGMKLMPAPAETKAPTAFVCPMDAEITATWAASCPKCGMTHVGWRHNIHTARHGLLKRLLRGAGRSRPLWLVR